MSRVDAAAAMDRLPWLPDEPTPQKRRHGPGVAAIVAGAAVVAVAAGGFWIGTRSIDQETWSADSAARSTTTVRLPPARPVTPDVKIAAQPQVHFTPVPEVRPEPTREVHVAGPSPESVTKTQVTPASARDEPEYAAHPVKDAQAARAAPRIVAAAPARVATTRPRPPRIVHGAAGRLVQVGAFGSVAQAKRGWWFMVRAYPAMSHLPAVVSRTRNSKGLVYFRFQVGTTSQAHSEVLCQRMRKIGLSCAVFGLPRKSKVER